MHLLKMELGFLSHRSCHNCNSEFCCGTEQGLTSFLVLQIDYACDVNGEVENPDVAQVSDLDYLRVAAILPSRFQIWQ